jgi:WD40 repeat protein
MITALDIKGNLVVSGSRDNAVKVWDIQKKRGISFEV